VVFCASKDKVEAMMTSGLTRPTKDDIKLESPDYIVYDNIDPNCSDRALGMAFESERGGGMCESLPRYAGSWLARHCSPNAVAVAAKAASDSGRALDPRTDMVLDGALRVLGACDEKAFERAIAAAPEDSPTIAIADSRGKNKLRAIFLPRSLAP
jgi:hypothetical protein